MKLKAPHFLNTCEVYKKKNILPLCRTTDSCSHVGTSKLPQKLKNEKEKKIIGVRNI